MYPSSQRPVIHGGSLTRYASAPSSLLTNIADSIIGSDQEFSTVESESLLSRYFSGDSSSLTSESSCKANISSPDLKERSSYSLNQISVGDFATTSNLKTGGSSTSLIRQSSSPAGFLNQVDIDNCRVVNSELQRSCGLNEIAIGDSATASNLRNGGSSSLLRHSSSPAGFFNHLMVDNGFSVTRGIGSYSSQPGSYGGNGIANARLKSQLSFTRQESLSHISEVDENIVGGSSSEGGLETYTSGNFQMGSWDDSKAIVFSAPHSKQAKNANCNMSASLNGIDSQFSLPATSLEMATVEKLLQIQKESVPCKIRAKRGFATHPRSIAERERRTRISRKMKKLFEFIPNMDKQTSNADMLDLALEHIKVLQIQVQQLNKDLENCTCKRLRPS